MPPFVGRAVGFVCGLFLVIVGFSLLTPDAGITHNGQTQALVSVLIALGIGVIAASALPNTLTVGGEQVKPLGMNLNASGGAAFFIVTLVFLFYTQDKAPPPVPQPTPTSTASSAPSEAPSSSPTASSSASPIPTAMPEAKPTMAPVVQQMFYRARTFCNLCCPQGPMNCQQIGYAQAGSLNEAMTGAVNMCVANGGMPDACAANVEQY